MTKQKILNLLGLAMRAGKLITGEELTIQDVRRGKTKFVFVAADASENTQKKISDKCIYYKVPMNKGLTHEELSASIGKTRMIVGVNDSGFAKKFQELIKG